MTTVNLTCPHCSELISINMPENDFPMKDTLPFVHCNECATIKSAQYRTEGRIKQITDNIRASTGKTGLIDKLDGALKAQYSSAKMLRTRLEARSRINRPKVNLSVDSKNRLPW